MHRKSNIDCSKKGMNGTEGMAGNKLVRLSCVVPMIVPLFGVLAQVQRRTLKSFIVQHRATTQSVNAYGLSSHAFLSLLVEMASCSVTSTDKHSLECILPCIKQSQTKDISCRVMYQQTEILSSTNTDVLDPSRLVVVDNAFAKACFFARRHLISSNPGAPLSG